MKLQELLQKKKILVSDGAMGTELAKRGLVVGECSEIWNIEHPDKVLDVYKSYVNAGSNIILTNTFGGSRLKLKKSGIENMIVEVNSEGVKLAKKAVQGTDCLVFASMGPTGELIEPLGDISEQEMNAVFSEQAKILLNAGADGIVIETMMSIEEAVCALNSIKKIVLMPVVVSMTYTFNGTDFVTMMGVTLKQAAEQLAKAGADVIGANCGMGTKNMVQLTKNLRPLTKLPVWIKPNAGLPELVDGKTVYRETIDEISRSMSEIIDAGADIVGGCCGFSPEHIKLVSNLVKKENT